MLSVRNLTKNFPQSREPVLLDATFDVGQREIVSIMGRSGEGKSTIARILCGTLRADKGTARLDGETLVDEKQNYHAEHRRKIQLIPQQPFAALDPRQKVGDAIAEPLLFHGLVSDKVEARTEAERLLKQVWLESGIYDRRPGQISGGQAQRVVIARSLTVRPQLLIAIEATSMLDISSQAQVVGVFRELVEKEGISMIFISHDIELVNAISNRGYSLSEGRLAEGV